MLWGEPGRGQGFCVALIRKGWAGRIGLVGFAEVVEADADEAEALRGGEADSLAEGERNAGEFFAGGDGFGRRERAGEDSELRSFEFKDDGARDAGFVAGAGPDFFGEAADGVLGFFEGDVALEGVFGGDDLVGRSGTTGFSSMP